MDCTGANHPLIPQCRGNSRQNKDLRSTQKAVSRDHETLLQSPRGLGPPNTNKPRRLIEKNAFENTGVRLQLPVEDLIVTFRSHILDETQHVQLI